MWMEQHETSGAAGRTGWRWLSVVEVALVLAAAGLAGCDEQLPGFANPPPYDAGVPDLDGAADDDGG